MTKLLRATALIVAVLTVGAAFAGCEDLREAEALRAAGEAFVEALENTNEAIYTKPYVLATEVEITEKTPPKSEYYVASPEIPAEGDAAEAFHNGRQLVTVYPDTIVMDDGFCPWGDGAPANLFDGADGFFNIEEAETFMGGGTRLDLTMTFQIEKAKITAYAFVTGRDNGLYHGRTPCTWSVYGCSKNSEEDEDWDLIDRVEFAATKNANHEYYGYYIDEDRQAEYEWIKVVFEGNVNEDGDSGYMNAIELNEMYLYTDKE